ncbi:MAG: T9SS type A sorting domain-containing protein, partial [Flavobacteriales bacterium]|nr:T9SS type A sorting domain-containing protein [Flavobacteriales bacterium]
NDGTFLWKRNYEFVGTQDFNNRIVDLISTSDGGFAAVGYHVNSDLDNPYPEGEPSQKAWFLKVDECGCLVPGCDPNCSTEVCPESPFLLGEDTFIIGPNPAQSHLNIYLGESEEAGVFELRNIQGQLVQSFTAAQGNTTFVLETATYAEGMYVLSYMNAQGEVLQSERVMVVE